MPAGSKLTVLVTLNTSHRSCSLWPSFHGIGKVFPSPMSRFTKPLPRRRLRVPTPPGRVFSKARIALAGSAKIFGPPFLSDGPVKTLLNTPTLDMGVVWVPNPVYCQFVGKKNPFPTDVGRPEVILKIVESCHPPIMVLTHFGEPPRNCLPWPTGSSQFAFMFAWWVRSKSETLLRAVGDQAFRTLDWKIPLRSSDEVMSSLLLNV